MNAADAHRSTCSSAYTSAMFSETRYAMNGDLRVAYRASAKVRATSCSSRTGSQAVRSFRSCRPSRGGSRRWHRSVGSSSSTSRAREPPIPSPRARCRRWSNGPTASPRCLTISAVAKLSSSRSTARSRPRRCSQQRIRPAQPRWSCSRATRIHLQNAPEDQRTRKSLP